MTITTTTTTQSNHDRIVTITTTLATETASTDAATAATSSSIAVTQSVTSITTSIATVAAVPVSPSVLALSKLTISPGRGGGGGGDDNDDDDTGIMTCAAGSAASSSTSSSCCSENECFVEAEAEAEADDDEDEDDEDEDDEGEDNDDDDNGNDCNGDAVAVDSLQTVGATAAAAPATAAAAAADEDNEPAYEFPIDRLLCLEEKIENYRWFVPVMPNDDLGYLLEFCIGLAAKRLDSRDDNCQRFYRNALCKSFVKLMSDEGAIHCKPNAIHCVYRNCILLIELIVLKLDDDTFVGYDLFEILFNPVNKFHLQNATRTSETVKYGHNLSEEDLFARPLNDKNYPSGMIVDFLNEFGAKNGFVKLYERFQHSQQPNKPISLQTIASLICPLANCKDLLTTHTIVKYIVPILELVSQLLLKISDEDLKKDSKHDNKVYTVADIIKMAKTLCSRVPDQQELIRSFDDVRLRLILRQLQIPTFNGKMSALNEINKIIQNLQGFYAHTNTGLETFTSKYVAKWIDENRVLEIVLKDSLHQPQYVDKLEKIIRFMLKEKTLSAPNLDALWAAQSGKHETIVKNVHDLLAKLAWDFTADQLDHLFECFKSSFTSANKKQQEKLLELIRKLAEDDKQGVMANKVLQLFWNLAHSKDAPNDIVDQALCAHVKILDYNCAQDRTSQKSIWLERCVNELKSGDDSWVLLAIKEIREIISSCEPTTNMNASNQQQPSGFSAIVSRFINDYDLIQIIVTSLISYMVQLRKLIEMGEPVDETYCHDGRFPHLVQLQERLSFLQYLHKEKKCYPAKDQAKKIWHALAENAIFAIDREVCFIWFSELINEKYDSMYEFCRGFFEETVLKLDPVLLTESGLNCFQQFFKMVNTAAAAAAAVVTDDKIAAAYRKNCFVLDNPHLIGLEYLWSVIVSSSDPVAHKAIEIMKDVHLYVRNRVPLKIIQIHDQFIGDCLSQMTDLFEQIKMLLPYEADDHEIMRKIHQSAKKIMRVVQLLSEYIHDCDMNYNSERKVLPLYRASRGKFQTIYIRFDYQDRAAEEYDINTHSNETVASLKRLILRKLGLINNIKLDLYLNNELIESHDDYKLMQSLGIGDKSILIGKLSELRSCAASSGESSSDESPPLPPPSSSSTASISAAAAAAFGSKTVSSLSSASASASSFIRTNIPDPGPSPSGSPNNVSVCNNNNNVNEIYGSMKMMDVNETKLSNLNNSNIRINNNLNSYPSLIANDPEALLPGILMSQCHENFEFIWRLSNMSTLIDHEPLKSTLFELFYLLPADACVIDHIVQWSSYEKIIENANGPTQCLYYLQVLYSLLLPANLDQAGVADEKLVAFQLQFLSNSHTNYIRTLTSNESLLFDHIDYATKKRLLLVTLKLTKFLFYVILGSAKQRFIDDQVVQGCAFMLAAKLGEDFCALPDCESIAALLRYAWSSAFGVLHFDRIEWTELHELCVQSTSNTTELSESDVYTCQEALECFALAASLAPEALADFVRDDFWMYFIQDLIILNEQISIRTAAISQLYRLCAANTVCLLKTVSFLYTLLKTVVAKKPAQSFEYFQLFGKLLSELSPSAENAAELRDLLADVIAWLRKLKTCRADGNVDPVLLDGYLCLARELLTNCTDFERGEMCEFADELLLHFIFPASNIKHGVLKDGYCNIEPICNTSNTLHSAFLLLTTIFNLSIDIYEHSINLILKLFYSDSEPLLAEWDYLPPIGPRQSDGFVGLNNAGATCYMNSVLQQLFMIKSVRNTILGCEGAVGVDGGGGSGGGGVGAARSSGGDDENRNDDFEEKILGEESRKEYNIEILKQVQVIFGHLLYSRMQYFVPKGLWKHFRLQGEPVNLREQQDAVEFFMSLTDSVDEALKSLKQEQIMSKVLGGLFSDQKICKDCPHRYSREEPFCVISVDVRNQNKLEDSLEQYVKGELLEGADAYYCDKCSAKVVTVKRLCVKKLPPVLAIQLKRFEYDYEKVCPIKFNDYFEFPRDLDMEAYTVSGLAKIEGEIIDWDTTSSADACTKYYLTGIVVHSGQATGGHYYSYISNRDDAGTEKWYKFDDREVTEFRIDDEELRIHCFGGDNNGTGAGPSSSMHEANMKRGSIRRQKRWWNAYMLFYTRVDCYEQPAACGPHAIHGAAAIVAAAAAVVDVVADENGNANEPAATKNGASESCALMTTNGEKPIKVPLAIEQNILLENIDFLHQRSLYTHEFFSFVQRLGFEYSPHNAEQTTRAHYDRYAFATVKLLAKFLFFTGFRTKKVIRGPTFDWFEMLFSYIKPRKFVSEYFCSEILLKSKYYILREYLLINQNDIRNVFSKLVVLVLQSLGPEHHQTKKVLDTVTIFLKNAIHDNSPSVSNYLSFFYSYATMGPECRKLLLDMKLVSFLILCLLNDNLSSGYGYQYSESGKVHQIVSILVRSCDVSHLTATFNMQMPARNIYIEGGGGGGSGGGGNRTVMTLPNTLCESIFNQTQYVRRAIDDITSSDEVVKLLRFGSWENWKFTKTVVAELLRKIITSNYQDFRTILETLIALMQMNDSWRLKRIIAVLQGVCNDRDGLLDFIVKNTGHYQKKSYLSIKALVQFFAEHSDMIAVMYNYDQLRNKWLQSLQWLHDELDATGKHQQQHQQQQQQHNNRNLNFATYSWPNSFQSNENSSGFYLERSNSAKRLLEKALNISPNDVHANSDTEEMSSREKENLINENIENSERSDASSSSPPTSSSATIVPSCSR